MLFDPKMGHGICEIRHIPFSCAECTSMLEKTWIYGLTPKQQPRYQTFTDWSYWPDIGSFNNCNIITLSQKATKIEAFEYIHQVFHDYISDNMDSLAQSSKYFSVNTAYTSTMRYYVINFVSEAYNLQDETTRDRKLIHLVN